MTYNIELTDTQVHSLLEILEKNSKAIGVEEAIRWDENSASDIKMIHRTIKSQLNYYESTEK